MLHHPPRKVEVGPLGRRRLPLGRHRPPRPQRLQRRKRRVALLHEPSARHAAHVLGVEHRRPRPHGDQPPVGLFAQKIEHAVLKPRRDHQFSEHPVDLARRVEVERTVDDHDPAKRRLRVGGERRVVGPGEGVAHGHAARVGVLEDGHGGIGRRELLHQVQRRAQVEQVVVRQRLAVQHVVERRGIADEPRRLVRVFAVAERLAVGDRAFLVCPLSLGEVRGDGGVVGGGAGEGVGGEAAARGEAERPGVCVEFVEDGSVLRRIGEDGHVREVLGGGARHRRPADVHVLGGHRVRRVRRGHGVGERVEVDDHEVERDEAVVGHRLHVLRVVALVEDAAVDGRVQRFYPSAEDFGCARDGGHVRHVQPRVPKRLRRSARRDEFDAVPGEALGERDEARFVEHRQQGAADGRAVGRRRQVLDGDHRAAWG